jgi:CRISPR/Cas system-associated exonuclease Cas4 (RecB family)
MHLASKTLARIDAWIEDHQDDKPRTYLGASVIGDSCSRRLWYQFRWASKERFTGRMLRLFDRGHRAEARFAGMLRSIGIEVYDVDEASKQFRASAVDGHFGGGMDGVAVGIPDVPDGQPCLLEEKTHNDASFKHLIENGVIGSKYKHFVQMQVYMKLFDLKYALYIAVNKNTDELHLELVQYDEKAANAALEKARSIIQSEFEPPRINSSPGWYECKYCHFNKICHFGADMAVNCRTCLYAKPGPSGTWQCEKNYPEIANQRGCPAYHAINDPDDVPF